jgi:hypothetical protein
VSWDKDSFANKALKRFAANNGSLVKSVPDEIKKDSPPSSKKEEGAEKESNFANPYEEYIKTWEQGDPIPLVPPGKNLFLCKAGTNELHEYENYVTDEFWRNRKSPSFKSLDEFDFKSLGPKLKESMPTLLSRVAQGRGLWVDDKNKLRCPPGTPAANQFTDITGSNCFIVTPQTAAGSARRAVRRGMTASAQMSGQIGDRIENGGPNVTRYSASGERIAAPEELESIMASMPVGSRIRTALGEYGIVGAMQGSSREQRKNIKGSVIGVTSHKLSEQERILRGRILTSQAQHLHYQFTGDARDAPKGGISRQRLKQLFPDASGTYHEIGDISIKENFMNIMTQLLPNVDPNEIDEAFENALPGGLSFFEHRQAKKIMTTFWEGQINEMLNNPDAARWMTRLSIVDKIDGDSSTAVAISVKPFAPSILSGGRSAGVAATAAAKKANSAAQGGVHVTMEINPAALLAFCRGENSAYNQFHNASGRLHSFEGKAHYLATHEFGHLLDFGNKLNALGLDNQQLTRYGILPNGGINPAFRTLNPAGPATSRRPNVEVGGWQIDLSKIQNPMNHPSIDAIRQAAFNLQTGNYTGGRVGHRRIDLETDLANFHNNFTDAFVNNINVTPEEHAVMAELAGGDYAKSNNVEARAEYFATMRLFGESTMDPSTGPKTSMGISRLLRGQLGGSQPVVPVPQKAGTKNIVDSFIDAKLQASYRKKYPSENFVPMSPAHALHGQWLAHVAAEEPRIRGEINDIGQRMNGISPGQWNISGHMGTGQQLQRDSLHANRVRSAVNRNSQQKRRTASSGIVGKMASKPTRPREPDNGPMTGSLIDIFRGCKSYQEMLDRYNKLDIIYFDYETTGFGADGNMPVQLGAVRMRGGKVIDRFNVFMNPGIPLGEWAQGNLKNDLQEPLTDAYLAQQKTIKQAHEELIAFMGENPILGGQYTPFDLEVLNRVLAQEGMSFTPAGVIDSKALSDELLPRWTPENPDGPVQVAKDGTKKASSSLGPLAEYLDVNLGSGWHTADADALASAEVVQRILERAATNPDTPQGLLDVDSIPRIVEQKRKQYQDDMQRYEKEMANYEQGVSGKMKSFTTENGSKYSLMPDGKLHRQKNPVTGTTITNDGEKGAESIFDNTVFVSRETVDDLKVAAERGKHVNKNGRLVGVKHDDSTLDVKKFLKLRNTDKKKSFDEAYTEAGGKITEYEIPESSIMRTPQVGLNVFEWNNDLRRFHAGSKIDSVENEPISSNISGKMSASSVAQRNENAKEAIVKKGGSFGTDVGTKYADEINGPLRGASTLPVQTLQTRRTPYADSLTKRISHIKALANGENVSPIHPSDRYPNIDGPDRGMLNELSGLDPDFMKYIANSSEEALARDVRIAANEFHAGIDPRVRIQVPSASIKNVIDSGVARKNATGNNIRKKYEAWIGIHPDTPEEMRPISGHVVHQDWLESELKDSADRLTQTGRTDPQRYSPEFAPSTNGVRGRVDTYGDVELTLRPEVSARTSYGYGDAVNDHIRPVGMNSDNSELIQQALIHSGHDGVKSDDTWNISPLEMLYGKWKKDFSAHRTRPGRNTDGSEITERTHAPMESLTLGGVKPEEIEHVAIDYNAIPKSFANFKEDPLSDDAILKMGITSSAKLDAVKNLREANYIPENMKRLETFMAAKNFKEYLDGKGIGLTVKNQAGLDVFSPSTHNSRAPKSADAEKAIRLNLQDEIKEKIAQEMERVLNSRKSSTSA